MGRGAGTGTSEVGGNACGGGPLLQVLAGPQMTTRSREIRMVLVTLALISPLLKGSSVYAAGSGGVVTMAQGGYNYGYGNVIQIDHGNGYVTVYAQLSQINVGVCTPVGQGTLIGPSGNTGNSFGWRICISRSAWAARTSTRMILFNNKTDLSGSVKTFRVLIS